MLNPHAESAMRDAECGMRNPHAEPAMRNPQRNPHAGRSEKITMGPHSAFRIPQKYEPTLILRIFIFVKFYQNIYAHFFQFHF